MLCLPLAHGLRMGLRTTLVTQFHVSPMLRCRASRSRGGEKRARPEALKTKSDEAARRAVMVSQMKGNAMPGGVHHGRIVSGGVGTFLPSTSKPPRGGRLAGSTEKSRERNDRKAKSGGTSGAGTVLTASTALKKAAIKPNCTAVAAGYLAVCAQSVAPSAIMRSSMRAVATGRTGRRVVPTMSAEASPRSRAIASAGRILMI